MYRSRFTNGEVDPRIITMRSDLELFVNGASKIRNAPRFPFKHFLQCNYFKIKNKIEIKLLDTFLGKVVDGFFYILFFMFYLIIDYMNKN